MTEAKFSPAPWEAVEVYHWWKIQDANGEPLARIANATPETEQRANARLMAKAHYIPELCEVLEDILWGCPDLEIAHTPSEIKSFEKILARAKQLIAEVKGEPNQ